MATARRNSSQQKGYLRFKVNFNDPGVATGNKKQTLPAGAIITRTDVLVTTAFNAATTNVLSVGIEPTTFTNIVTTAQAVAGTAGLKSNLPPTGTALGPLAADSDVYALYTQTGTAATAGAAYVIIEYVCDNDLNVGT